MDVENFELRGYKDVNEIANALKDGKKVIVNLNHLENSEIRRVTDFLSGVIYIIGGNAKKVADKIYEFVPQLSKEQIITEDNTSRIL